MSTGEGGPDEARQAVTDAQARAVGEVARCKEVAGIGRGSTAIWVD
jgi:hypothetical protein